MGTGISFGTLTFNLVVTRETSLSKKELDNKIGFAALVGSNVGHYLLGHTSIPMQSNRIMNRKVEIKFEWAKANANGGPDGGYIVLRVLYEGIRGLDLEYLIPMRF